MKSNWRAGFRKNHRMRTRNTQTLVVTRRSKIEIIVSLTTLWPWILIMSILSQLCLCLNPKLLLVSRRWTQEPEALMSVTRPIIPWWLIALSCCHTSYCTTLTNLPSPAVNMTERASQTQALKTTLLPHYSGNKMLACSTFDYFWPFQSANRSINGENQAPLFSLFSHWFAGWEFFPLL